MADDLKAVRLFGVRGETANKVAAFQQKVEEDQDGTRRSSMTTGREMEMTRIKNMNDSRYGRPPEGSKTERRGKQAGNHVSNEIRLLCDLIHEHGERLESGSTLISFGDLFQMYTRISNKVVGILMRARKYGLVHFDGEMLYQKRDDNVIITLIKPIEELRAMFEVQGDGREAGEAFAGNALS